jgi:hypothetical protein
MAAHTQGMTEFVRQEGLKVQFAQAVPAVKTPPQVQREVLFQNDEGGNCVLA